MSATTASAAAVEIHLSCCRSTPRERRKRHASAAADAIADTSSPTWPSSTIADVSPSATPSGFSTRGKSSSGPGRERVAERQQRERGGHERPGRPPPARGQAAVGEQQQQRGDERREARHPDPVREPQQRVRRRRRSRLRVERADVPAGDRAADPERQRRQAQQPADRVAGPARGEQPAERRERHEVEAVRDLPGEADDLLALVRGESRAVVGGRERDRDGREGGGQSGQRPGEPPHRCAPAATARRAPAAPSPPPRSRARAGARRGRSRRAAGRRTPRACASRRSGGGRSAGRPPPWIRARAGRNSAATASVETAIARFDVPSVSPISSTSAR